MENEDCIVWREEKPIRSLGALKPVFVPVPVVPINFRRYEHPLYTYITYYNIDSYIIDKGDGNTQKKLEQLELERPKSSKMQDYNKIQHSRRPSSPEENPEYGTETIKMMRSKVTIAMQAPTVPMPPPPGHTFLGCQFSASKQYMEGKCGITELFGPGRMKGTGHFGQQKKQKPSLPRTAPWV